MKNNYYIIISQVCFAVSITALIMAEYGISSVFGNWHPTHETAIAFGIISIASSNLAKLIKNT